MTRLAIMRVSVVATGINASAQTLSRPNGSSDQSAKRNLHPSQTLPSHLTQLNQNMAPREISESEKHFHYESNEKQIEDVSLINNLDGSTANMEEAATNIQPDLTEVEISNKTSPNQPTQLDGKPQNDIDPIVTNSDNSEKVTLDDEQCKGFETVQSIEKIAFKREHEIHKDSKRIGFIPAQTTSLPDADTVPPPL